MTINTITIPEKEIANFCQRWKINQLALFGSSLREDFGPDSDIDVLVSFASEAQWTLLDHVEMQYELETILGRDVDLVSKRGIENSRNHIRRQEILNSATIVYASK